MLFKGRKNVPPKQRLTREAVLETALNMVRKSGLAALNARALASKLSCSTQPIFSNFASMDDLKLAVTEAAISLYRDYTQKELSEGRFPAYKASGMAYIRFAKEEPKLFELLFMCDRRGQAEELDPMLEELILPMIVKNVGMTLDEARRFHFEIWAHVHGIAVFVATSYFEPTWEQVSDMVSNSYFGLLSVYQRRGNKNEND